MHVVFNYDLNPKLGVLHNADYQKNQQNCVDRPGNPVMDQLILSTGNSNQCNGKPEAQRHQRDGGNPTRYGDWERNGRCIDF